MATEESQDIVPTLSLHQRILGDIEQNILTGRWPPGHKVPSEQQLAEEYACSRMTVNKVLTQLAQAGLVQRRRRVGSVVLPQGPQSAILEIYDIREEVEALRRSYRYEILSRSLREADKAEKRLMDIDARQKIADITCLHFAGGKPFCLEQRLINLSTVPEAAAEEFKTLSPGPWLLDHVPWSAAEHTIAARGADDLAARHLGLAPGAPVMVVERQTWRLEKSVTRVRLTYPGESHILTARFTPAQAQ
jgi:GntR family histidine utilization transcriptional repressor